MANITGTSGPDSLNGTNGNDSISGLAGNDTIHGNSGKDTIDGGADDDIIDAGNNADTVNGGDGNDEIYGGPRGQSNTDGLTGGDGADFFYLTYDNGSTSSSPTSGFWSGYIENFLDNYANFGISNLVSTLEEAAAESFLGKIVGSILLTGVGAALESGVKSLLHAIFGHSSPPPPPQTEDIMVVADFDPREDVLFLPIEEGKQIFPIPGPFANTATGDSGIGVEFTYGTEDTAFADVLLDTDFLAEFGITSFSTAAGEFINDLFAQSLQFSSVQNPDKPDAGGILDATAVYPFPTDSGSYVSGEVPSAVSEPLALTAPSNTQTRLYGAFGPVTVVGPSTTSTGVLLSGTNLGDIVFLTPHGFAPDQWDDATVVSQVPWDSTIKGFDGDDILNGSLGQDDIDGGDGDDLIYGWNADESPNRDQLVGGTGDDTLFAAKPRDGGRAAADFDGDDSSNGNVGNDTVSFVYSRWAVTANLTSGTGVNDGDTAIDPAYTFVNVENLTGTVFADSLTGDGGDNVLQGNAGSDTLNGGGGLDTVSYADNDGKISITLPAGPAHEFGAVGTPEADTVISTDILTGSFANVIGSAFADAITGDANDNVFQGNAGSDTIIGGGGRDTVTYVDNTGKVTINLVDGTAREFGVAGSSSSNTVESTDQLSAISIVRGSPFDDVIDGDGNANEISGLDGNDSINGAGGDDTIDGDAGRDTLNGAGGVDTVSYAINSGKVTVNLLASSADEFGATGGSAANAIVSTDSLINFENILGSQFNDFLVGDGSDNILDGGGGNDTLNGSTGSNTVTYANNTGLVFLNLAKGFAHQHGPAGTSSANSIRWTDALTNIQNVIGTPYNDTITGSSASNILQGNAGSDSLIGGGGTDTASYVDNTGKVTVNLADGTAREFGAAGSAESETVVSTDRLSAISHVRGSSFDDAIDGDGDANVLSGEDGDDTINGGGGNDTIGGDAGNDILDGGNEGLDTASYQLNTGKVVVDLNLGEATEYGADGGPDADSPVSADSLMNFETIFGSPFDDLIKGDTEFNFLSGAAGNDTLDGGDGDDTLSGGDGDDVLNGDDDDDFVAGDAGNDRLNGGDGVNTVSYAINSGRVAVDLGGVSGSAQEYGANGTSEANTVVSKDTLRQFNNVEGSRFNDVLTGDPTNNAVQGNAGNDTLDGVGGTDTVTGGAGDDVFALSTTSAGSFFTDFEQGVDRIGLVSPLSYNDLSFGKNDSNDIFVGSQLLATLIGVVTNKLTENDFITLNPDVADAPITNGGGGTSGDDFIFGSDEDDTLAGGSGNDTLNGNGGDDDIDGGSDNDVLRGDLGDDTVRAGSGDDTASGGEGNDSVFGGSGDDDLAGAGGDDTVLGTADDDELFGGSGADSLIGGSGDDTLNGGPGDDTSEGGDGDDIFVLRIGDGDDTVIDFEQGVDLIGLSGGLGFEDLTLSGSNILSDEETLATLTGVDAATLTEFDFVMV